MQLLEILCLLQLHPSHLSVCTFNFNFNLRFCFGFHFGLFLIFFEKRKMNIQKREMISGNPGPSLFGFFLRNSEKLSSWHLNWITNLNFSLIVEPEREVIRILKLKNLHEVFCPNSPDKVAGILLAAVHVEKPGAKRPIFSLSDDPDSPVPATVL